MGAHFFGYRNLPHFALSKQLSYPMVFSKCRVLKKPWILGEIIGFVKVLSVSTFKEGTVQLN